MEEEGGEGFGGGGRGGVWRRREGRGMEEEGGVRGKEEGEVKEASAGQETQTAADCQKNGYTIKGQVCKQQIGGAQDYIITIGSHP